MVLTNQSTDHQGLKKILQGMLTGALKSIPGASAKISQEIDKEAEKTVSDLYKKANELGSNIPSFTKIPEHSISKEELMPILSKLNSLDNDPSKGKMWAYVYQVEISLNLFKRYETEDQKIFEEVIQGAFNMFMNKNALNPFAFPSLRRMETEVIKMSTKMLNGDENVRGSIEAH